MLFFLNFAFVFHQGKMEVSVGIEMKAQSEGGDGYFSGWTSDDWEDFITSGEAEEFDIDGKVWDSLDSFLKNADPDVIDDFYHSLGELDIDIYDPSMFGLNGEDRDLLIEIFENMKNDCLTNALLKSTVGTNIGFNSSISTPGNYNPTTNSVSLRDPSSANAYTLTAELFHSYQDRYGNLSSYLHVGRSNAEFEEKFMGLVVAINGNKPYSTFNDMEGVDLWIMELIESNNGRFPTSFTDDQKTEYMCYLTNFQQANIGNSYGGPIDPTHDAPYNVMELLDKSDCYE